MCSISQMRGVSESQRYIHDQFCLNSSLKLTTYHKIGLCTFKKLNVETLLLQLLYKMFQISYYKSCFEAIFQVFNIVNSNAECLATAIALN